MKLKPVGLDTQLENCLFGMSQEESQSVKMKIEFAEKNQSSIIAINGKPVFHPIVKGKNVYYYLSKAPAWLEADITPQTERKYYYPIQYAEITFFNNNTP